MPQAYTYYYAIFNYCVGASGVPASVLNIVGNQPLYTDPMPLRLRKLVQLKPMKVVQLVLSLLPMTSEVRHQHYASTTPGYQTRGSRPWPWQGKMATPFSGC